MLTDAWKKVIIHDFQNSGMNLTNILEEKWEEYKELKPHDKYLLKTPTRFGGLLGFTKQVEDSDFDSYAKYYCVHLEFNSYAIIDITVPDIAIGQTVVNNKKNWLHTIVEKTFQMPEGDMLIQATWDYIKLSVERIYPTLETEIEKSLKQTRLDFYVHNESN